MTDRDPKAASPRSVPLDDSPFSYVVAKTGKVLISHHGKQVTILKDKAASKFIGVMDTLSGQEAQRHMASVTGQYKFGNERVGKDKSKR